VSSIKVKVIEFVKQMPENATIDDIVNALEEKKEMVENTSMAINETGIDLNDIKNEILSLEDNWDGKEQN